MTILKRHLIAAALLVGNSGARAQMPSAMSLGGIPLKLGTSQQAALAALRAQYTVKLAFNNDANDTRT
jgi:hypothetical protein